MLYLYKTLKQGKTKERHTLTTLHLTSNLIDTDTRTSWDYQTDNTYTIPDTDLLILWLKEADFQPHNLKTDTIPNRYTYTPEDDTLYVSLYTIFPSSIENLNPTQTITTYNLFINLLKTLHLIKHTHAHKTLPVKL